MNGGKFHIDGYEFSMAEERVQGAQVSNSKDGIVNSSHEEKNVDNKDFTSIKVICLGDSAVGKSK